MLWKSWNSIWTAGSLCEEEEASVSILHILDSILWPVHVHVPLDGG